MPEAHEAKVKRFVAERLIVPAARLDRSTQLQADIGLTGPEGPALISAFADAFAVDVAQFEPERHFYLREWDGLARELLRFALRRRKRLLVPITVGDLIAAAQSKSLIPGAAATT